MMNSTASLPRTSWAIWRPATWRQIGTDLFYILPGFLVSIASFTALTALFTLGLSTIVVWVGLPVLVACLATARWFANLNRAAMKRWASSIPPVHYRPAHRFTISGMFKNLADPQLWKDFAHGFLVAFPLRTATFSVVLSIMAAILGGLTQWFWLRFLPADNTSLAALIGLDRFMGVSPTVAEGILGVFYGIALLLLFPFITRLLAMADAAVARGLLTNENAALRARDEKLTTSRAQVVSEEASTLRRIERDLHDGPQQRLIRLQMDVEAAQRRMDTDPAAARELMDGALEQSREALNELRQLSRGIAPPLLADRGLRAAAESLAARSTVPVSVAGSLEPGARLPQSAENAAYFVISEALANVSKHSGACQAGLSLDATAATLVVEVIDDGVGGAHVGKGHGLSGLVDRLAGVDGSLEIISPDGGPTTLRVDIPLHG
ncbi:sensor histidine kinase [Arthrobacter psychrochitiniphilus]|uniref:histidine kinase n=1 Tax=Arthrobacter psychrochitiniphilus TaxID=291045 RepID=A0A2V3DRQ8_9MICC|nr:sensor histidine kinase [Arthrobacter psychrochitiniphilus]NYG19187.1 signal transduction histidine kinase [Arthrobacter psychrochitiniphilus]PXA65865.1 sensor histidine kinase [Arthrobacter psychrochitiniphilus]